MKALRNDSDINYSLSSGRMCMWSTVTYYAITLAHANEVMNYFMYVTTTLQYQNGLT
jgi:hypothetical protein